MNRKERKKKIKEAENKKIKFGFGLLAFVLGGILIKKNVFE